MAGENRHPDRITALASGFAAFLALAVSTYNVVLQRQQIRAQVWPHLSWTYSQGAEQFTIQVSNEGVGPAIIETVQLSVDKKPVPDWDGAFDKLGLPIRQSGFSSLHHAVIPAGGHVTMLTTPEDELAGWLAEDFRTRLTLDVCYCSVLHDCWDLDGPRKNCPKAVVPFRQ